MVGGDASRLEKTQTDCETAMAGAAMRELYDSAAKQRVTEGAKKGGVEKSKKTKVDSCPVALLPQGTIELQEC